jgi:toxin CptA
MRALRLVFVLHVACIGLLPFAMQPGWPLLVLVAAFGVSWFALRHSAVLGFGTRTITRLIWHADGRWSVFRGAQESKAELLGSSLVHAHLLVLNFRLASGARVTRLLAGDETSPELLRRLRARLSLKA